MGNTQWTNMICNKTKWHWSCWTEWTSYLHEMLKSRMMKIIITAFTSTCNMTTISIHLTVIWEANEIIEDVLYFWSVSKSGLIVDRATLWLCSMSSLFLCFDLSWTKKEKQLSHRYVVLNGRMILRNSITAPKLGKAYLS